PDELPWVFDKSYRGEAAKETAGLGLGLYISRLLVEAHGGRISATSDVGQGSTVAFSLPVLTRRRVSGSRMPPSNGARPGAPGSDRSQDATLHPTPQPLGTP